MTDCLHAAIDLSALRHNLAVVARHAPGAKVMAVVKSLAYGHGAVPLALALQDRVDAFGLARIGEAVTLREAGVEVPLVVLEGPVCADDLALAVRHGLSLVLHHESQLQLLAAVRGAAIHCWLKLDTGMHRLGFDPQQAPQLLQRLRAMPGVARVDLMTHLANADDTDDDTTHRQLQRMHAATDGLTGEVSIANSAGILAWPQAHADWVRPGLMLYGASPLTGRRADEFDLRPAMTLRAPLIAVKALRRGEPVGYGGTWTAPQDMPLGVVGIGYGDGYPRHIGRGAQVLINGVRVPLVGRVSMDMITIDLRSVDASVGDMVTLWGEGLPADEVAAWADTIPYTLFCGVTARVQRRYLG